MPRRRPFLIVPFVLAAVVSAAGLGPARGAEAGSDEAIQCYPAIGPAGRVARFCESRTVVTVEPLSSGTGPSPSPDIARLHADATLSQGLSWLTGSSEGQDRWTGISLVGEGFGGAWRGGHFAPQAGLGLRMDGAPLSVLPVFIGAEIGYRRSLLRPPDIGGALTPPSGAYVDLRVGSTIGDRLMVFGTAGLQDRRPEREQRPATGWSVGVGASYALDTAWAVTIQYRFIRVPSGRTMATLGAGRVNDDASLLLGGVTYRFLGL